MATTLREAVIRISIDPQGARAEVAQLEKTLRSIDERRQTLKRERQEESRQDEKKVSDKKRELQEKAARFSLPPLTAADVVGAIPVVGGLAKVTTQGLQRFGPGLTGVLDEGAKAAMEGVPEPFKTVLGGIVDKQTEFLKQAQGKINEFDAFLRAFHPTWEQVKAVAKAQMLVSGAVDITDIGSFAQNEFMIQQAQLRLQKSIEDETLRQLGAGGTKQLLEATRKLFKKN